MWCWPGIKPGWRHHKRHGQAAQLSGEVCSQCTWGELQTSYPSDWQACPTRAMLKISWLTPACRELIAFSFPAINGLMFGNLPGLDVCEGDRVSWHLLGLGSEADVHGAVFQGNTMQINGMRRDSANLFPHTFATAFMQPDNSGECLHS